VVVELEKEQKGFATVGWVLFIADVEAVRCEPMRRPTHHRQQRGVAAPVTTRWVAQRLSHR
jgi:hypothetical protein